MIAFVRNLLLLGMLTVIANEAPRLARLAALANGEAPAPAKP